jgi:predicted unusual protein kinase regulating ubiquinone biosynthesis (AarF/ABC1/UbiB family)
MAEIPKNRLSRGAVLGKALVKAGAVHAKGSLKQALGDVTAREQTEEALAKIVMESLGTLKGVSVKVAQQIALMLPVLPERYLDEMQKSFQSVAPINRALLRKLIKQELGNYPEILFETFDPSPIGSASLGQVHRACYRGRDIALKVQYPGIATTLDGDLRLVEMGLKRFAKGNDVTAIMQEISERLHEEVDYLKEAQNIETFRQAPIHPGIRIPEPLPELCTPQLLTTELFEGRTLRQFLDTSPSQEQRNYYAQLMFDTLFEMLYRQRRIHADPNPGNFLFMEDNQLGLLDFGCIKQFDESFLNSFTTLHRALIKESDDAFLTQCYVELGMIDPNTPQEMQTFYREVIKPLDHVYIEVFKHDHFRFSSNRAFSRRGFQTVMQVYRKQFESVHKFSADYLFLDRTIFGYYAIFEQLDAVISTAYVKSLILPPDDQEETSWRVWS